MRIKNIVLAIVLVLCLLVTSTGCSDPEQDLAEQIGSYNEYDSTLDEQIINAKSTLEIKQLFKLIPGSLVYSEYSGEAEEFAMYFSLMDSDTYVVVDAKDDKYVLFKYEYSDYDAAITSVNSIDKSYRKQNNCVLEVSVDYETSYYENPGCFPHVSLVYCILKLDEDLDGLMVGQKRYYQYYGGLVYVNHLYGVVNSSYDTIVPIKYSMIRNLETFGEHAKKYYFICTEDGAGLMDVNYEVLIPPSYLNIEYLSENRFIVQKDTGGGMNGLDGSKLYIIDEEENVYFGPIDGFLAYKNKIDNPLHQLFIGRIEGDNVYEGVIDDELNVIIDTIYTEVTDFWFEDNDCFYVVVNENGETAVIDSSGKQQTEFKDASVYEAQEAYYHSLSK